VTPQRASLLNGKDAGRSQWAADITLSEAASKLRDAASLTDPYGHPPVDLTIFVSCYNEADYIYETLETVCAAAHEVDLTLEILVIDDCSTDHSRDVVLRFIANHPEENVILRANRRNCGLAQNYLDGAFLGTGAYYRLVCGDNPEPKETLLRIFSAIGTADCIVPIPELRTGRSIPRLIISNAYTFIINAVTGNRIGYYNGLAVHLRQNVIRWHTNTRGFGFQAEILCLLIDAGFTYVQVPVRTHENRTGKSNALTIRNFLSVAHTIVEITNRRISGIIYTPRGTKRRALRPERPAAYGGQVGRPERGNE
jgi:glycosyltransferase involved in cell wall biosynthesis